MRLASTTAKRGTLDAMAQTLYLLDLSFSTHSNSDPVLISSPLFSAAAQFQCCPELPLAPSCQLLRYWYAQCNVGLL